VAKGFVFNPDYEELVRPNHTVLLGARGCGKTTLMKMLTIPAIYGWNHSFAEKLREKLPFYTVYISTDIYWNAQMDAYSKQLERFPKYADVVSKVAVTTNVLYALCETFEDLIKHKTIDQSQTGEIQLCKELIKLWILPATVPTLVMIKECLIQRTDELNRHIQRTLFNARTEDDVRIEEASFFLDYDTSSHNAIVKFERIFSVDDDMKWALCFDELELAPDWLQKRLFGSLRSRNQKVLYKLSASPIVSIEADMIASSGNDFRLIKMWPYKVNKEYEKFIESLAESILNQKLNMAVSPEILFGTNPVMNKARDSYAESGPIWKEIKELSKTDDTLKQLLLDNRIDPENPVVSEENIRKMDTLLRKIKPIVYFRNYYSVVSPTTGKRKARSRKAHTLFFGHEVLYRICDGNPRWLIGILSEMAKHIDPDRPQQIPEVRQATTYEDIANQFFDVVKAVPNASASTTSGLTTLYGILEEIGQFFFEEIVIGEFQRDPWGTFEIDEKVPNDVVMMLEKAVYQGAIVLLDPSENAFDFQMRGKKFKLSYLLAPKFKLPLRKYPTIALSRILSGKHTILFTQGEIQFNSGLS
jgi:hypothetical protein